MQGFWPSTDPSFWRPLGKIWSVIYECSTMYFLDILFIKVCCMSVSKTCILYVKDGGTDRPRMQSSHFQLDEEMREVRGVENWKKGDKENQGRKPIWIEVNLSGRRSTCSRREKQREWKRDGHRKREEMEGVRWCSPSLSHSLAVLLGHRHRLCTHNSVWFRTAIDRSRIISSIIFMKVWPDCISRTLVSAARRGFQSQFRSVAFSSVQFSSLFNERLSPVTQFSWLT